MSLSLVVEQFTLLTIKPNYTNNLKLIDTDISLSYHPVICNGQAGLKLAEQLEIRGCCAHIFTETCLQLTILDPAVELGGLWSEPRRGGLGLSEGVYATDAWFSYAVKLYGQRLPDVALFFTVNMPTTLSSAPCCRCLHSPRSIVSWVYACSTEITANMFCLCCMKYLTNFLCNPVLYNEKLITLNLGLKIKTK